MCAAHGGASASGGVLADVSVGDARQQLLAALQAALPGLAAAEAVWTTDPQASAYAAGAGAGSSGAAAARCSAMSVWDGRTLPLPCNDYHRFVCQRE